MSEQTPSNLPMAATTCGCGHHSHQGAGCGCQGGHTPGQETAGIHMPAGQMPAGDAPAKDMPTGPRLDLSQAIEGLALSPLDGRYRQAVAPLGNYLSEAALNRERINVEVEWFIFLASRYVVPGTPKVRCREKRYLREIVTGFGPRDVAELATIEAVTRHDVKAVEYLIKGRMRQADQVFGPGSSLPGLTELVHFCCTSEDINNLAYALCVRGAVQDVWLPAARRLIDGLTALAREHRATPMLARTHGQPATPTTLGKELAVFAHRLTRQLRRVEAAQYLGKINGATGTYAAHMVAVPSTDWPALAREFVSWLGLDFNPLTTQIESHDWMADLFADIAHFGRIAHNVATDMWTYISLGYFAQVRDQGSVGSSTMPHKVNPIRFENAEANLEIGGALLDTLGATLVTSRMQRDLTDSTTLRNIGVGLGHQLLALDNLVRGLGGLEVNTAALAADLDDNWEVLGEAIQCAMRAAGLAGVPGMDDPYERLKELTRGRRVDAQIVRDFVASLGLPPDTTARLVALTPASYVGAAPQLIDEI